MIAVESDSREESPNTAPCVYMRQMLVPNGNRPVRNYRGRASATETILVLLCKTKGEKSGDVFDIVLSERIEG